MSKPKRDHIAGAGKEIEVKPGLCAECVFIGKATSPKVVIDLDSTDHKSFSGIGKFEMGGEIFYAKVTLMPEKIGSVFAKREGKHVVYPEGSE